MREMFVVVLVGMSIGFLLSLEGKTLDAYDNGDGKGIQSPILGALFRLIHGKVPPAGTYALALSIALGVMTYRYEADLALAGFVGVWSFWLSWLSFGVRSVLRFLENRTQEEPHKVQWD